MNRFFHLHQFSVWLNQTAFHLWVSKITKSQLYAVPIVQGIHLVAICVIIGSVGMLGLRMAGLFGAGGGQPLAVMARRLLPWTWAAIAIQIATGILMVVDRPGRALDSLTFPYKMAMLIAAILLTALFGLTLKWDPGFWDEGKGRRVAGKLLGVASVLVWVGIIVAGRWIYYEKAPI